MMVTRNEAKAYLRIDYTSEDCLICDILHRAENLCRDESKLSLSEWDDTEKKPMNDQVKETIRVAVLYAVGYLYDHRENESDNRLNIVLRNILYGVREGKIPHIV